MFNSPEFTNVKQRFRTLYLKRKFRIFENNQDNNTFVDSNPNFEYIPEIEGYDKFENLRKLDIDNDWDDFENYRQNIVRTAYDSLSDVGKSRLLSYESSMWELMNEDLGFEIENLGEDSIVRYSKNVGLGLVDADYHRNLEGLRDLNGSELGRLGWGVDNGYSTKISAIAGGYGVLSLQGSRLLSEYKYQVDRTFGDVIGFDLDTSLPSWVHYDEGVLNGADLFELDSHVDNTFSVYAGIDYDSGLGLESQLTDINQFVGKTNEEAVLTNPIVRG